MVSAAENIAPGTMIGDYKVTGHLGEGGFGVVLSAEHPVIGKRVAVKILSHQYSSQPDMVARFKSEARAVNQIESPFIVDIFAFGELPDGRSYYVMEHLVGEPLDVLIANKGMLGKHDVLSVLQGVTAALDSAHQAGIAHRDLKPENVFVRRGPDGKLVAKLLDFGIAKLLGDTEVSYKTQTGAPMGTPYYMSPEQCRGRDVDRRTDIYALGVMTFEMLTGRVPFDGEDYLEILMKQINEQPPPVQEFNQLLNSDVNACVLEMMAKDPNERPQTCTEAFQKLSESFEGVNTYIGGQERIGLAKTLASDMPAMPVHETALESQTARKKWPLVVVPLVLIGAAVTAFFALSSSKNSTTAQAPTVSPESSLAVASSTSPLPTSQAVASVPVSSQAEEATSVSISSRKPSKKSSSKRSSKKTSSKKSLEKSSLKPADRNVLVTVAGSPAGAKVFYKGDVVGQLPRAQFSVPYSDKAVPIRVRKGKFRTKRIRLIPNKKRTFKVALERRGGNNKSSKKENSSELDRPSIFE